MTDRARYLAQWGFIDGTPEADEAWAQKLAFKPQRLMPLIMGDIEPYRAMGTDIATGERPVITSRSQHREYLARNNYVEIGNEYVAPKPPPELSGTDLAHDIKRSIEQTGARL